LSVISTNKSFVTGSTEVTAASATDTITFTAHGLSNGDQVSFTSVDVATNIRTDRTYYVVSSTTNTFKVSLTSGGAALTLGTAAPKYVRASGSGSVPVTVDFINALIQGVYDNGGMSQGDTRTLFVPSIQKVEASPRRTRPRTGRTSTARSACPPGTPSAASQSTKSSPTSAN
jgi:hypothetical protein